jgi:hypothetical protein
VFSSYSSFIFSCTREALLESIKRCVSSKSLMMKRCSLSKKSRNCFIVASLVRELRQHQDTIVHTHKLSSNAPCHKHALRCVHHRACKNEKELVALAFGCLGQEGGSGVLMMVGVLLAWVTDRKIQSPFVPFLHRILLCFPSSSSSSPSIILRQPTL